MFKDIKIPIIIIMIITILIILCFTYEVHDNLSFFDNELSDRYLSYEEAIHKMQNPRIVICENETGLIAVSGDHKGPHFTRDCVKWYHISQVPRMNNDYVFENLFNRDYDEYVYPWYNPLRWYHGSKPFYGYRRWNNPWRKWRGRNNPWRGKRGRSLMRGESPKRSRSLTRGGSPKRNRGTPKGASVGGGKRGGGKRGGGASSRL